MREPYHRSSDFAQLESSNCQGYEYDDQEQLTDYLMGTRGPNYDTHPVEGSVAATSARPRHRLLIDQALRSDSAHSSLSNPQASVVRWKVPTGALVILALVLSGFALWPLVGGSGGNSEVIPSPDTTVQGQAGSVSMQEPNKYSETGAPTSLSPTSGTVFVHVTGQVATPGLYELKPGSRIHDALTAAGGPTPEANTSAVNLAELVSDGTQIYVPAIGEEVSLPSAHTVQGKDNTSSGSSPSSNQLVNLNTADAAELQTLPKVGPVLAESIIAWREEHGGFQSVDELDQVSGIGPATLEKLRPLVTVL